MIESLWQLPASKTTYTQPLIKQSISCKLFIQFSTIYRKQLIRLVERGVDYDVSKWEHGHWSICEWQLWFQKLPTDRCNEKEIFSSDPLMWLIIDDAHSVEYFWILLGIGSNQFVAIFRHTPSIQGWFRYTTLYNISWAFIAPTIWSYRCQSCPQLRKERYIQIALRLAFAEKIVWRVIRFDRVIKRDFWFLWSDRSSVVSYGRW